MTLAWVFSPTSGAISFSVHPSRRRATMRTWRACTVSRSRRGLTSGTPCTAAPERPTASGGESRSRASCTLYTDAGSRTCSRSRSWEFLFAPGTMFTLPFIRCFLAPPTLLESDPLPDCPVNGFLRPTEPGAWLALVYVAVSVKKTRILVLLNPECNTRAMRLDILSDCLHPSAPFTRWFAPHRGHSCVSGAVRGGSAPFSSNCALSPDAERLASEATLSALSCTSGGSCAATL